MTRKTRKNSRSQLLAYKCLTKPQLGEIISAFQSQGNQKSEIVKQIEKEREQIQDIDTSIRIETKVTPPNQNRPASLYINYIKDNEQVMHYSVHLCPKNVSSLLGPTHFRQNAKTQNHPQSRAVDVYPDPTDPNKVVFVLGEHVGRNMNDPYIQESELVLKALNKIWNTKPNAQQSQTRRYHRNLNSIYNTMQNTLREHNKTRRRRNA
jgi:hypothetical protein